MFAYKKALCRHVPKSLAVEALRMEEPGAPIDYKQATREHEQYIQTLKQLGLEVVVLDADENLPDCVFVEDPAIVCGDKALITNPGHANRKREVVEIKNALEGLVGEVTCMESPAEMDGGDVLFTGKEFFVGLSTRTNQHGADVLRSTFPAYPVHTIGVRDATLHLKSMLSMASDDVVAHGPSQSAVAAVNEMKEKAKFQYSFLKVSTDAAANCLWINGTLIHRSTDEFPDVARDFASLDCPKLQLANTELCKVDGALTCCSLLIN